MKRRYLAELEPGMVYLVIAESVEKLEGAFKLNERGTLQVTRSLYTPAVLPPFQRLFDLYDSMI